MVKYNRVAFPNADPLTKIKTKSERFIEFYDQFKRLKISA